ncbi:MAG: sigma-70 family RNA polymerase sigma factor [Solirubrobacteraceae bacterium]
MTLALSVLIFGYLDIVTRRVALKVPTADVDDVAHEVILSAIRSAFAGESIGEFRAWLNRITARRIADYHRKLEGKPKTVPLLTGEEEDDAGWGEVPSADFEGDSVDAERAIESAYNALSDAHKRIVDGNVFEDRPAPEVAGEEGTSPDNVHQVVSRFRRRVRELLEDGEG